MKKNLTLKSRPPHPQSQPNIEVFLSKIEQHLLHLERKIDVVIAQNSAKSAPAPAKDAPAFFQQDPRRERVMHKATCADCGNGCEVPFRPTGERPVYCKECFAKRKSGGGQRSEADVQKVIGGLKPSDFQKLAKGKPIKIKKSQRAKKGKK